MPYFLTADELKFFEALGRLMVPTGSDPESDPGAKEVGTANYIDSDLSELSKEVQDYYRASVRLVDSASTELFNRSFVELSAGDQNMVLRKLYRNSQTRERIFDLRSIVLEGFYSDYHDPDYRGKSAWELLGFSGKRISDLKKDWTFLRIWREWQNKREKER